MNKIEKVPLRDLNPHLVCALCGGYLIQATTIQECLHSFCKSCLIRYLETSNNCPICDVHVHQNGPLLNIREDKLLQTMVYKMVPGLYHNEMASRRKFADKCREERDSEESSDSSCDSCDELIAQDNGSVIDPQFPRALSDGDDVSVCLLLSDGPPPTGQGKSKKMDPKQILDKRYLLCPAKFPINLLVKFIKGKFELYDSHEVDVYYHADKIPGNCTLMDVCYLYNWKRTTPLDLHYTVTEMLSPPVRKSPLKTVTSANTDSDDLRSKRRTSTSIITPMTSPSAASQDDATAKYLTTPRNDLNRKTAIITPQKKKGRKRKSDSEISDIIKSDTDHKQNIQNIASNESYRQEKENSKVVAEPANNADLTIPVNEQITQGSNNSVIKSKSSEGEENPEKQQRAADLKLDNRKIEVDINSKKALSRFPKLCDDTNERMEVDDDKCVKSNRNSDSTETIKDNAIAKEAVQDRTTDTDTPCKGDTNDQSVPESSSFIVSEVSVKDKNTYLKNKCAGNAAPSHSLVDKRKLETLLNEVFCGNPQNVTRITTNKTVPIIISHIEDVKNQSFNSFKKDITTDIKDNEGKVNTNTSNVILSQDLDKQNGLNTAKGNICPVIDNNEQDQSLQGPGKCENIDSKNNAVNEVTNLLKADGKSNKEGNVNPGDVNLDGQNNAVNEVTNLVKANGKSNKEGNVNPGGVNLDGKNNAVNEVTNLVKADGASNIEGIVHSGDVNKDTKKLLNKSELNCQSIQKDSSSFDVSANSQIVGDQGKIHVGIISKDSLPQVKTLKSVEVQTDIATETISMKYNNSPDICYEQVGNGISNSTTTGMNAQGYDGNDKLTITQDAHNSTLNSHIYSTKPILNNQVMLKSAADANIIKRQNISFQQPQPSTSFAKKYRCPSKINRNEIGSRSILKGDKGKPLKQKRAHNLDPYMFPADDNHNYMNGKCDQGSGSRNALAFLEEYVNYVHKAVPTDRKSEILRPVVNLHSRERDVNVEQSKSENNGPVLLGTVTTSPKSYIPLKDIASAAVMQRKRAKSEGGFSECESITKSNKSHDVRSVNGKHMTTETDVPDRKIPPLKLKLPKSCIISDHHNKKHSPEYKNAKSYQKIQEISKQNSYESESENHPRIFLRISKANIPSLKTKADNKNSTGGTEHNIPGGISEHLIANNRSHKPCVTNHETEFMPPSSSTTLMTNDTHDQKTEKQPISNMQQITTVSFVTTLHKSEPSKEFNAIKELDKNKLSTLQPTKMRSKLQRSISLPDIQSELNKPAYKNTNTSFGTTETKGEHENTAISYKHQTSIVTLPFISTPTVMTSKVASSTMLETQRSENLESKNLIQNEGVKKAACPGISPSVAMNSDKQGECQNTLANRIENKVELSEAMVKANKLISQKLSTTNSFLSPMSASKSTDVTHSDNYSIPLQNPSHTKVLMNSTNILPMSQKCTNKDNILLAKNEQQCMDAITLVSSSHYVNKMVKSGNTVVSVPRTSTTALLSTSSEKPMTSVFKQANSVISTNTALIATAVEPNKKPEHMTNNSNFIPPPKTNTTNIGPVHRPKLFISAPGTTKAMVQTSNFLNNSISMVMSTNSLTVNSNNVKDVPIAKRPQTQVVIPNEKPGMNGELASTSQIVQMVMSATPMDGNIQKPPLLKSGLAAMPTIGYLQATQLHNTMQATQLHNAQTPVPQTTVSMSGNYKKTVDNRPVKISTQQLVSSSQPVTTSTQPLSKTTLPSNIGINQLVAAQVSTNNVVSGFGSYIQPVTSNVDVQSLNAGGINSFTFTNNRFLPFIKNAGGIPITSASPGAGLTVQPFTIQGIGTNIDNQLRPLLINHLIAEPGEIINRQFVAPGLPFTTVMPIIANPGTSLNPIKPNTNMLSSQNHPMMTLPRQGIVLTNQGSNIATVNPVPLSVPVTLPGACPIPVTPATAYPINNAFNTSSQSGTMSRSENLALVHHSNQKRQEPQPASKSKPAPKSPVKRKLQPTSLHVTHTKSMKLTPDKGNDTNTDPICIKNTNQGTVNNPTSTQELTSIISHAPTATNRNMGYNSIPNQFRNYTGMMENPLETLASAAIATSSNLNPYQVLWPTSQPEMSALSPSSISSPSLRNPHSTNGMKSTPVNLGLSNTNGLSEAAKQHRLENITKNLIKSTTYAVCNNDNKLITQQSILVPSVSASYQSALHAIVNRTEPGTSVLSGYYPSESIYVTSDSNSKTFHDNAKPTLSSPSAIYSSGSEPQIQTVPIMSGDVSSISTQSNKMMYQSEKLEDSYHTAISVAHSAATASSSPLDKSKYVAARHFLPPHISYHGIVYPSSSRLVMVNGQPLKVGVATNSKELTHDVVSEASSAAAASTVPTISSLPANGYDAPLELTTKQRSQVD